MDAAKTALACPLLNPSKICSKVPTPPEAIIGIDKIFEIQSKNSKLVKNRFVVSKENLKENGFSDIEIKNMKPENILID